MHSFPQLFLLIFYILLEAERLAFIFLAPTGTITIIHLSTCSVRMSFLCVWCVCVCENRLRLPTYLPAYLFHPIYLFFVFGDNLVQHEALLPRLCRSPPPPPSSSVLPCATTYYYHM